MLGPSAAPFTQAQVKLGAVSLAAPDPTTLKKRVWGNSIQQNVAPPECEWHQSDRSI